MRLFHVSEESDIQVFEPRLPKRDDLDKNVGLVWAVEESHLPMFLTPRNCPRIAYHAGKRASQQDKDVFFSSSGSSFGLVIEAGWFEKMRNVELYLYEFDTSDFSLQDEVAGYYVAYTTQIPTAKHKITDVFAELMRRKVEIRIVDNLWELADKIRETTLDWSLCRMHFAQPRRQK